LQLDLSSLDFCFKLHNIFVSGGTCILRHSKVLFALV